MNHYLTPDKVALNAVLAVSLVISELTEICSRTDKASVSLLIDSVSEISPEGVPVAFRKNVTYEPLVRGYGAIGYIWAKFMFGFILVVLFKKNIFNTLVASIIKSFVL